MSWNHQRFVSCKVTSMVVSLYFGAFCSIDCFSLIYIYEYFEKSINISAEKSLELCGVFQFHIFSSVSILWKNISRMTSIIYQFHQLTPVETKQWNESSHNIAIIIVDDSLKNDMIDIKTKNR